MGLLDGSFNFDDPRTMGLLNAGLGIMAQAGDTSRPFNLGQGLAGGLSAYTGTLAADRKQKQLEEALRQKQAHDALLMQSAQMDLAQRQQGVADRTSQATNMARAQKLLSDAAQSGQPVNYQSLQAQGVPYEMLKQHADSQNLGREEVKYQEVAGADGSKILQPVTRYGDFKGAGIPGYVAPTMTNLGDRMEGIIPKVGQSYKIGMSPAQLATDARERQRLAQSAGETEDAISPLTKRMVAQQYLAGDTGALQNYGRGAQGAKNLNALRAEIAKQASDAGLTGADIAAKNAEFMGIKAGQRTAGVRTANIEMAANELNSLAPLALDASKNVQRSGFLPFGKAQIMFNSNTNDPSLREFAMANNALVNVYGQVMSRGGVATVSDKDHAREILSTAFDQPSYEAAVKQLLKETKAAQEAPKAVRKDLSEAISGRSNQEQSKTATMRYNPSTGKLEKVQ